MINSTNLTHPTVKTKLMAAHKRAMVNDNKYSFVRLGKYNCMVWYCVASKSFAVTCLKVVDTVTADDIIDITQAVSSAMAKWRV